MTLRSLSMKWFRGAASEAVLPLDGKSVAVYGPNGSGKSSFVDAVEVCINGGKVNHLSHEYSGRYQEKGIINTARPAGERACVELIFSEGQNARVEWNDDGSPSMSGVISTLSSWEYSSTVLRQEDLTAFIHATKGEKYSKLLPLLGLASMELLAENLRKIVRGLEQNKDVIALKTKIEEAARRRKQVFGDVSGSELLQALDEMRSRCGVSPHELPKQTLEAVFASLQQKAATLDEAKKKAAALSTLHAVDLAPDLDVIRGLEADIARSAVPLIELRVGILEAFRDLLVAEDATAGPFDCPACGTAVEYENTKKHVELELERFNLASGLLVQHRNAVSTYCDKLVKIQQAVQAIPLEGWRSQLESTEGEAFDFLKAMDLSRFRFQFDHTVAVQASEMFARLSGRIAQESADTPDAVNRLVDDQQRCIALKEWFEATELEEGLTYVEGVTKILRELESVVREEISIRARSTFTDITSDIQKFWAILNPSEAVSDVHLYVPEGAEKAIEVGLKFHGSDQNSPRLTLSEGHRNALGLCIFLAMANRGEAVKRPLFLDDVIISFDREHRSRVVNLLEQECSTRQVVLFTHDREWFFELQRRLPQRSWVCRRLSGYESPIVGIRFLEAATEFESAKAKCSSAPEDALSSARRIMDVALNEIAESIGLMVAHRRGEGNDHRTAGEFLIALGRQVDKCLRKKSGEQYVKFESAIDAIKKVKPELGIWANRGTHTYSGSSTEAKDLIDSCEALLSCFKCEVCNTHLGFLEKNSGVRECRCGSLRWKPE